MSRTGLPACRAGKVYLVGAGPGDPSLITVKGRRILETAESVLYDNLASEALVELAPAQAERLYVGKKRAAHAFSQEEICELLIERARRGLMVVRLKGGDPFIFGRGGEEAEALADAGIPFEVVPGITTPLGIAAYTGVPLTHREHTSAVSFVTGHAVGEIDWDKVGMSETLVIFMGLTTFSQIAHELISRGRPAETPAMAVRWATRPDQETLSGTLATLPGLIERQRHEAPGHRHRGGSGAAAGETELVRAAPAVRQAHRGDAGARAGGSAFHAPGSARRRDHRDTGDRDPAGRGLRTAGPRDRRACRRTIT